ncbi:hypothetical protein B4144_2071 [Bacillus atrophaeus]|nr:hypothetical protein B4144_2071 [Bacillus atrophaeus]
MFLLYIIQRTLANGAGKSLTWQSMQKSCSSFIVSVSQ